MAKKILRGRPGKKSTPQGVIGCVSAVGFTRAKLGEPETSNEDSFQIAFGQGRFAVADGVSKSYNPRSWSQCLVRFAVESDEVTTSGLASLAASVEYQPSDDEPWYATEMREKGSQSTLMRVEVIQRPNTALCRILSIGDCCAFQMRLGQRIGSWPFSRLEEFPVRPNSVSTQQPFILGQLVSCEIELTAGDELWVATDAVSRYVMELTARDTAQNVASDLEDLRGALREDASFAQWIDSLRESREMEDDDVTLLCLGFGVKK